MSHQPPLQMFKVFESVARHGQLNAAARELHVTVGAVSHMLRSLPMAFEHIQPRRAVSGRWYAGNTFILLFGKR